MMQQNRIIQANARDSFYVLQDGYHDVVDDFFGPITINGITVEPSLAYLGENATLSDWIASTYGNTLGIAGSGADVTIDVSSVLLGDLATGVKFNAAKFFQAPNTTDGNVGTNDFIFDWIATDPSAGDMSWAGKLNDAANKGWLLNTSGTNVSIYLHDGTTSKNLSWSSFTSSTMNHYTVVGDRSGSMSLYRNATLCDTLDISAANLALDSSTAMRLGAWKSGGNPTDATMFCFFIFNRASWLDSHLQANFVKKRHAQAVSLYPRLALGTALPEVI